MTTQDPGDDEVVRAVRRAASGTTPPASTLDVDDILAGGRRRLARRHRAQAMVSVAATAAAAVVAVVVITSVGSNGGPSPTAMPAASTPGASTPGSSPSSSQTSAPSTSESSIPTPTVDRPAVPADLAALVADPATRLQRLEVLDATHQAAVLSNCEVGPACQSAVLVTADGWASSTGAVFAEATSVVAEPVPGGGVVVIPSGGGDAVLLSPDGSTQPLTHDSGTTYPDDGVLLPARWSGLDRAMTVYDPAAGSLHPVQLPGSGTLQDMRTRPGTGEGAALLVVGDAAVSVLHTTDGGRSWSQHETEVVASAFPPALGLGPDGRLTLVEFGGPSDRSLTRMRLSEDAGATWTVVTLPWAAREIAGRGYDALGRTYLLDDPGLSDAGLWRVTEQLTLERVSGAPAGGYMDSPADRLVIVDPLGTAYESADAESWSTIDVLGSVA